MVASSGGVPLPGVLESTPFVPPPPRDVVAGPVPTPVPGTGVAVQRLGVPLLPLPPLFPPPQVPADQRCAPLVPFAPSGEYAASAPPQMAGLSMYRMLRSDGYSAVAGQKGLYRSIHDEKLQTQEHLGSSWNRRCCCACRMARLPSACRTLLSGLSMCMPLAPWSIHNVVARRLTPNGWL